MNLVYFICICGVSYSKPVGGTEVCKNSLHCLREESTILWVFFFLFLSVSFQYFMEFEYYKSSFLFKNICTATTKCPKYEGFALFCFSNLKTALSLGLQS